MFKKLFNSRHYIMYFAFIGMSLTLFLYILSPAQLPVLLYKVALVIVAAIVGLFFDLAAFPYAKPSSYLSREWKNKPDAQIEDDADYPVVKEYKKVFAYALLRRAIIVAAFVLAVALGL